MRRGWLLFVIGWALVLGGGLWAHGVQTSGGVRVRDVRFVGADGTPMSGLLYIPVTATRETPAPGILAVHGYINSRETQDGFAIEFARRGYVVLAIDQTGHGYSGGAATANGFGGPEGLAYLRSLAFVDPRRHRARGPQHGRLGGARRRRGPARGYRAMVLEGSSTGVKPVRRAVSRAGTPACPRNLAVVYSRYDEFAPLMWEVPRAVDVGCSAKLMRLFGRQGAGRPRPASMATSPTGTARGSTPRRPPIPATTSRPRRSATPPTGSPRP